MQIWVGYVTIFKHNNLKYKSMVTVDFCRYCHYYCCSRCHCRCLFIDISVTIYTYINPYSYEREAKQNKLKFMQNKTKKGRDIAYGFKANTLVLIICHHNSRLFDKNSHTWPMQRLHVSPLFPTCCEICLKYAYTYTCS